MLPKDYSSCLWLQKDCVEELSCENNGHTYWHYAPLKVRTLLLYMPVYKTLTCNTGKMPPDSTTLHTYNTCTDLRCCTNERARTIIEVIKGMAQGSHTCKSVGGHYVKKLATGSDHEQDQ